VFVVGHLGDWRRAAAVLFERESVFGNPPTRGAAWQGVARSTAASLTSSGRGVERCGESRGQGDVVLSEAKVVDFQNYSFTGDQCGTLQSQAMAKQNTGFGVVAFGGQMSSPQVDVELSQTIQRTNPQAVAFKPSHFTRGKDGAPADVVAPLSADADKGDQDTVIATPFTKSKRAQSTTDDETWVPGEVSPTMSCFDQGDTRATTVVAFTTEQTPKFKHECALTMTKQSPSGGGQPQCVAFANRTRDGVKVPEVMPDGIVPALTNPGDGGRSDAVNVCVDQPVQVQWASGGGQTENQTMQALRANAEYNYQFLRQAMAVRRLTPRECERLQGFPDDYTLVEYRKKPAADGPRYRALGNSMAVPVMRWIGERIQQVDRL
jgi:DNA (cytosine-5)-methyltransferase 1